MRKNQKNTKEKMYALIQKCESSELTQEKFFQEHGISKSTFGYWRKKYLKEKGKSKRKDNFIPVTVDNASDQDHEVLELVYPNGVRIVCSSKIELSRLKSLIVL